MNRQTRIYAHALSVWSRNPAGFAFSDVAPTLDDVDLDSVWTLAPQEVRDAGLSGDSLDDALDLIETTLAVIRAATHPEGDKS